MFNLLKKTTHVEHIKRAQVFNTSIINIQNMCFIKLVSQM